MSVKEQGFSLLEVLIAMAISSVLLLGAARFLPALQRESLTNTRKLALEDEIWLRVFTVDVYKRQVPRLSSVTTRVSPTRMTSIVYAMWWQAQKNYKKVPNSFGRINLACASLKATV